MSIDKQIEEMAKTLCEDYGKCKKCTLSNPECENPCMVGTDCERLYNAGYRKQSEVAREIFEHLECMFSPVFTYTGETIKEYIAELKKKYTESEKDNG